MNKIKIKAFAKKWMKLEIAMLSKISQFHNDKFYMFSLIYRT